MKYLIFTVRDRALPAYSAPFSSPSRGAAIRSFADEVNRVDANNPYNRHPDDYDLYALGSFDDATGSFDIIEPEQIAVGKDLIRLVS